MDRRIALALGLLACAAPPKPHPDGTPDPRPGAFAAGGQRPTQSCRQPDGPLRPILVELPPGVSPPVDWVIDRGLLAVHAVGCDVEVLRQCRIPGKYSYKRMERPAEHHRVTDAAAARGLLPLSAQRLDKLLGEHGIFELTIDAQGVYRTGRRAVSAREFQGDCGRATHLVTTLAMGTWRVRVPGREITVAQGGDPRTCRERRDRGAPKNPPHGCATALWAEVVPVEAPTFGSDVRMTAPEE